MFGNRESTYKWYILILATLTMTFVVAMPRMCMPVLFDEISKDLELSLVQLGLVWGMLSLGGMFVPLIAGSLGDRFGIRTILSIACLLAGLLGALRGLSDDFVSLATAMFLFGIPATIVPVNVLKTASIWFSGRHLGLATGAVSTGMAVGFMLGAMISATILSPLLGGWRNVLFLYGGISIAFSILWFMTVKQPPLVESSDNHPDMIPLRATLSRVIRIRRVWLLGLVLLGYMGCIQGVSGYLPLYLRETGWTAASADSIFAIFNGVSVVAAIPLVLLSNRFHSRITVLLPALILTAIGVGLLLIIDGIAIWVLVIIVGIFRDGFMAITLTMTIEAEGVGKLYSGTATGLVLTLVRLGSFFAPPLGNSLANIGSALPFGFWAVLPTLAISSLYFVGKTGRRKR